MQVVVTEPGALPAALSEVDAELDAIEAAASRFVPDSELNALCASAGRPTKVGELLAELLGAALTAARETDGDVDPTIGGAMIALGYDRDLTTLDHVAPAAATAAVSLPANWLTVTMDGPVVTVPPGVLLDLGATAKAVAADHCAERVHRVTGSGVLINLGGDIATAGPAPEGGWQVLVQDDPADPPSSVALAAGAALATSSTIHRQWRRGPDRVHHILDPRTGWSAAPVWRTVSVGAQTCLTANTVSTAAVVRGWKALNWIRGLGLSARLVDANRAVHTVGGWPTEPAGGDR
jgi:FAD:protein FMN transferase